MRICQNLPPGKTFTIHTCCLYPSPACSSHSLSEEKAPCSHRTNGPQKKKLQNTNNLKYTWKMCGKQKTQVCLLPHQEDHRVLLEKEGHCTSSCLTFSKTWTHTGKHDEEYVTWFSSNQVPSDPWHKQWSFRGKMNVPWGWRYTRSVTQHVPHTSVVKPFY